MYHKMAAHFISRFFADFVSSTILLFWNKLKIYTRCLAKHNIDTQLYLSEVFYILKNSTKGRKRLDDKYIQNIELISS